ncbi:MAG TPA: hypothetical protein VMV92_08050 [Streptosporangiaceae bacterium]|nr:hypothetical protein [Streptosporangiaceae bacterium]
MVVVVVGGDDAGGAVGLGDSDTGPVDGAGVVRTGTSRSPAPRPGDGPRLRLGDGD